MLYDIITFGSNQAGMAQSVAHFIGSEEVTGSIPVASFKKLRHLMFQLFLCKSDTIFMNKGILYQNASW